MSAKSDQTFLFKKTKKPAKLPWYMSGKSDT